MKKILALTLALLMIACTLLSCNSSSNNSDSNYNKNNNSGKETKIETKATTKSETKVETKATTKSETKVETKATTKSETKVTTDTKKETISPSKTETDIEASKGLNFELIEYGKSYSVTGIGYCQDTEIIIPDTHNGLPVTSIGDSAFYDNKNIISITIPNSITSIGYKAFSSCSNLTSVSLGSSITNIGDAAFLLCDKLIEVINKSNFNITKGSGEYGGVAEQALEVHNGESKIVNKNGYLFYTYGGTNYLVNYIGTDSNITLPVNYDNKNYVIHQYAFARNKNILSVTISDSVTSIGDRAFVVCSNLMIITIGNNVTKIDGHAFYNCTSLASATFKCTSDWNVSSNTGSNKTSLSSSDLANTSTAAKYLTKTYPSYSWERN